MLGKLPKLQKNITNSQNLREAGRVLRDAFNLILTYVQPGVSLQDIDFRVEKFLRQNHALSTPRLLNFPYQFSASINYEVVNGYPDDRCVVAGDIISIDMGIFCRGVFVDKAVSVAFPPVSGKVAYLLKAAQDCLDVGIRSSAAGANNKIIGKMIEMTANYYGMSTSPRFSGHAIGEEPHMYPLIPNVANAAVEEVILREGQSITIEPIVFYGSSHSIDSSKHLIISDSISAHFEETIIIHSNHVEVVT